MVVAVIQVGISSETELCSPWYKIESLEICLLMFNADVIVQIA